MNNFKLYPFQKNKYFYGKLLTVRDFELEQKYIDEKRYLLNRIMFGNGIASGLKVVWVDEQTIVIEPGVAIDNLGREIIVPNHITEKLSFIEGFKNDKEVSSFYLCLGYSEHGKERVRSISGAASESDELREYNRIQESYKLILKEDIEKIYKNKNIDICYKNRTIYEDEYVIIKKRYPTLINTSEIFEVVLDIEKKSKDVEVEFSYLLKSTVLSDSENTKANYVKVNFKEPLDEKEVSYQYNFLMVADKKPCESATMSIDKEDFVVKINNNMRKLSESLNFDFEIIEENKKERVIKDFNNLSMEKRIESDFFDYIYLAKIDIIKIQSAYIIKKILPVPFNQYIYNNNQLKNISLLKEGYTTLNIDTEVETKVIDSHLKPKVDVKYDYKGNKLKFDFQVPRNEMHFENIVTGTVDVEVNETFMFGKNFVSEEIFHGLGLGPVFVHVGVEEAYDDAFVKEEKIYYGDPQVFYKSDFQAEENLYSLGTIVYPNKGSFRIGLRLQASKKSRTIRLRWWAYKNLSNVEQQEHIKVVIDPSEITLNEGESFQFSGIVNGDIGDEISWSLEGEDSGTISEAGLYVAPEKKGLYKVKAVSKNNGEKSAYAIVTVKSESDFIGKAKEFGGKF